MKKKSLLLTILCGTLLIFCTLLAACTEKDKNQEETEEAAKAEDMEKEIETINLSNLTTLEVITDCTKFTPVTQDQSYHFETDMNPSHVNYSFIRNFTDLGDTIYMSRSRGGLFAFQKDTGSAGIACDKPDCEHDMTTTGGDCQANLHMLDLDVSGLQYYNGDIYYTLGLTMLYKMSPDGEVKYKYASLLGEKEYGTGEYLIHRGNIYFYAKNEGIYKMPIDNPSYKELIVGMPEGSSPTVTLQAYGSYVYFTIYDYRFYDGEEKIYAAARYNIESNQIEQFLNIKENEGSILVHDGKIYYQEYQEDNQGNSIYRYDIASGENEIFLQGERNKGTNIGFYPIYGDLDYIYISKWVYEEESYYTGGGNSSDYEYLAYTWDGEIAGEILMRYYTDLDNRKPLEIHHFKNTDLTGSDSGRIYYMSMEYDWQINEDGTQYKEIEGSRKLVISYINKSELSVGAMPVEHIAGEISVEADWMDI